MSAVVVYVTAASREDALAIARTIVGERLAACANVSPAIDSIYWWEGKLTEDAEASLILKTTEPQLPALIARVRAVHPYTCPAIVAWRICDGNPDYLAWIERETAAPPP